MSQATMNGDTQGGSITGTVTGIAKTAFSEMLKTHGPVAVLLSLACTALLVYVHFMVIVPGNEDRKALHADRQQWMEAWQEHATKDNEVQGKIAEALTKIDMRLTKLESQSKR